LPSSTIFLDLAKWDVGIDFATFVERNLYFPLYVGVGYETLGNLSGGSGYLWHLGLPSLGSGRDGLSAGGSGCAGDHVLCAIGLGSGNHVLRALCFDTCYGLLRTVCVYAGHDVLCSGTDNNVLRASCNNVLLCSEHERARDHLLCSADHGVLRTRNAGNFLLRPQRSGRVAIHNLLRTSLRPRPTCTQCAASTDTSVDAPEGGNLGAHAVSRGALRQTRARLCEAISMGYEQLLFGPAYRLLPDANPIASWTGFWFVGKVASVL
jgi:hypothetical protein